MRETDFTAPAGWSVLRRLRSFSPGKGAPRILAALFLALIVAYGAMMATTHIVDDDLSFAPAEEPGLRSVLAAAALIERETDRHRWTANDPWFAPGAALDNMPEFQQGVIAALARFSTEMTDHVGRTRGSSQVDPDLEKAAGLLKYPGDIWIFDFSTSWAPTAPSENQYRAARRALLDYNKRVVAGQTSFDPRSDTLIALLDRFAADLGSASAAIDSQIEEGRNLWVDLRADNVFYNIKGKLYAYLIIMRALEHDFGTVIKERDVTKAWKQTLHSLEEASRISPVIILNGAPDGNFVANHLAIQGFYLLRARTQLREIEQILQK